MSQPHSYNKIRRVLYAGVILFIFSLNSYSYCAEEKFNIILISVDCLRPDHLGCYGYNKDTSPNIDRLADEGIIFSNAITAASWTLPAQMSLFTSKYSTTHGVIADGLELDKSDIALAEILKGHGFITAGFVSGPFMDSYFGFGRGFDLYDDYTIHYDTTIASHRGISSPRLNEAVLNWLSQNYHSKFFIFIHYFDTHEEYIPPSPYKEMLSDPYDGEIRFVDEHIGVLLNKLKELGVFKNSLIILTADHGDEFMEHSMTGHRHSLFQEVIRIPLIFKLPLINSAKKKLEDYVSIIDIMPTILDISNIPLPDNLEGVSLYPLIYNGTKINRSEIYAELFYSRIGINQISVIEKRYKLIYYLDHPEMEKLFDLFKDPGEKNNLLRYKSKKFKHIESRLFKKIGPRIKNAYKLIELKEASPGPTRYDLSLIHI